VWVCKNEMLGWGLAEGAGGGVGAVFLAIQFKCQGRLRIVC
jgi:hypothetical protein